MNFNAHWKTRPGNESWSYNADAVHGGMIPLLGAGAPTCCKGGELRQSILLLRQRRRWAARAVLVSLLKEEWEDEEQEGKKGKFASEW